MATPQTWQGADRRRAPRYAVEAASALTATASGRTYSCELEDISVSGLRLRFAGEPPKGPVIAIDHPLAGTLCGACVWCGEHSLGVEIQSPGGEIERILRCVCLVL